MYRTYVRRRLTVLLAALVATFVLAGPVSGALRDRVDPIRPVADRSYVVEPGDTLWAIAVRAGGDRDPRAVVQAILDANDVDPGSLQPGKVLWLPPVR